MTAMSDTLPLDGAAPAERPPVTTPAPATPLGEVDQLLRSRSSVLRRIEAGDDLAGLARSMILTIAAAGGVFGAAVGSYRGGLQILYAAIKLPLVILLTAAVCAPALTAINAALDRRADLRRDLALVLSALALGSLVLAAQAPLILLAGNWHAGYHGTTLLLVTCCAVGGIVGLTFLSSGVASGGRGAFAAVAALLVVFLCVGSQMSWTLRPYLVRPRATSVPFLRPIDSSLLESVVESLDSARGIYHRDAAPLPGSLDAEVKP